MASRQIFQLTESTPTNSHVISFQQEEGEQEAQKVTIGELAEIIISCSIYRALVTQASTGAPTATVLENTLGTISFSRSGVGIYSIDSSALFTVDKTFVSPQYSTIRIGANYTSIDVELNTTSSITIRTYIQGTASDDVLDSFPIEILVYP